MTKIRGPNDNGGNNRETAAKLASIVTGAATITAGNSYVDVALGTSAYSGKTAIVSIKTATDATALYVRGYSYPDASTLRITVNANATGSVVVTYLIDGR